MRPDTIELNATNPLPMCRAGLAPHTMLLTGPNMGGKSTLLRAACCAVILAQTGCPVPAESAVISVTDRIFTRLGILSHGLKCLLLKEAHALLFAMVMAKGWHYLLV